jgi:hypothetical protein
MSLTSVVAAAGPAASTPRGPPSTSPTFEPSAASTLPGARSQRFLALMVGAPAPLALAPPEGSPSTAE